VPAREPVPQLGQPAREPVLGQQVPVLPVPVLEQPVLVQPVPEQPVPEQPAARSPMPPTGTGFQTR
jgi:hypothetical protein